MGVNENLNDMKK